MGTTLAGTHRGRERGSNRERERKRNDVIMKQICSKNETKN